MTTYTVKKGQRLDQIVYDHYNSLEMFDKVLNANLHLLEDEKKESEVFYYANAILSENAIVNLPTIQTSENTARQEVPTLW